MDNLSGIFDEILSLTPSRTTELEWSEDSTSPNLDALFEQAKRRPIQLSGKKRKGFSLPSININLEAEKGTITEKDASRYRASTKQATASAGDGLDLGVNLPEIQAPDITLPDIPDINAGIDLSKVGQELPIEAPDINVPLLDIDLPDIDLPNIGFQLPEEEITVPDLKAQFPDVDFSVIEREVIKPAAEKAKEVAEPVIEAAGEVATEVSGIIAGAAKPVADVIAAVSEPAKKAIDEAVSTASEIIGDTVENIVADTLIREGDGSGYGEISIAGSEVVLDIAAKTDKLYQDVTKNTVLEGSTGADVYKAATKPTEFVREKGTEAAKDTMVNTFKMDAGLAQDVVDIANDPEKALKEKSKEQIANVIVSSTAENIKIDKALAGDVAGALVEVVTADNIEQAATNVMKNAATTTTLNVVEGVGNSIIPGAGSVVKFIAQVFRYGCYLGTAAYAGELITREEYLMFSRYRLRIQKKERLSEKVWLGYLIAFKPLFHHQLDKAWFNLLITSTLTKPWLRHIQYLFGRRTFNLRAYLTTQLIRLISICAYGLSRKKHLLRVALADVNIMPFYKQVIRSVEYGR